MDFVLFIIVISLYSILKKIITRSMIDMVLAFPTRVSSVTHCNTCAVDLRKVSGHPKHFYHQKVNQQLIQVYGH